MTNVVGLKEFRANLDVYSRLVSKGQSVVVLKHAKPVFKLVPVSEEEVWQPLIDFTEINPAGVPIKDVAAALNHGSAKKSSRKTPKRT